MPDKDTWLYRKMDVIDFVAQNDSVITCTLLLSDVPSLMVTLKAFMMRSFGREVICVRTVPLLSPMVDAALDAMFETLVSGTGLESRIMFTSEDVKAHQSNW